MLFWLVTGSFTQRFSFREQQESKFTTQDRPYKLALTIATAEKIPLTNPEEGGWISFNLHQNLAKCHKQAHQSI